MLFELGRRKMRAVMVMGNEWQARAWGHFSLAFPSLTRAPGRAHRASGQAGTRSWSDGRRRRWRRGRRNRATQHQLDTPTCLRSATRPLVPSRAASVMPRGGRLAARTCRIRCVGRENKHTLHPAVLIWI